MAKKKLVPNKSASKKTGTKAQAIRDESKAIKTTSPKEIVAALGAKGIKVTSPQVSTTLKAAGMRKGRRKKGRAAGASNTVSNNGHSEALNISHLVSVKKLAEQLGGIAKVKSAVAALERLQ